VIVVSYNGGELLPRAIRAIQASVGVHPRVIVVDNASTDDSRLVAARLGATVVPSPRNVGYGVAFNLGLKQSAAPWIACSNQDLEIGLSTLAELVAAAETYESEKGTACITAPQLLTAERRPAETCHRFPSLGRQVIGCLVGESVGGYRNVGSQGRLPHRCDWVSGAFLVGRNTTFRAIGGFNTDYFMYVEDLDFFRRLADAGLHCVWVPTCEVVHFGGGRLGASSPLLFAHALWNLASYHGARRGRWAASVVLLAGILGSLLRAILWSFRGFSDHAGRPYVRMFAGAAFINMTWVLRGGPPQVSGSLGGAE